MTNKSICRPAEDTIDRKDQAIGRIVGLLPLFSVKELDAMADRLRQKIGQPPEPFSRTTKTQATVTTASGIRCPEPSPAYADKGADCLSL